MREISARSLALAGAAIGVRGRPDLSLQHVLEARDGQGQSQNGSGGGPFDEREIPRIRLDFDSQLRARYGNVQPMREAIQDIPLRERFLDLGQLPRGQNEIEIQTHQRLDVGVDCLTAHDAIGDALLLEQGHERLQEVGFVQRDRLPELSRSHARL